MSPCRSVVDLAQLGTDLCFFGDLVVAEVQPLERLELACGGLGHQGGHALVADVGLVV